MCKARNAGTSEATIAVAIITPEVAAYETTSTAAPLEVRSGDPVRSSMASV